jgi:peroxiredoxin
MRRLSIVVLLMLSALMAGCDDRGGSVQGAQNEFVFRNLEGESVSLSEYRGKVVLLEFWATWCPPCRMAVPDLNELYRKFEGEDFVLLAVSVGEKSARLKDFAEEQGIDYTILIDDWDVNSAFGVITIPTTFLLDREGAIVKVHKGYAFDFEDFLAEEIQELI